MTTAHDLFNAAGDRIAKFPHRSPVSALTLLRFTAPNRAHPTGQVIAKGHPPFAPEVIGLSIRPRSN